MNACEQEGVKMGWYICDSCRKRFGGRSVIFEMGDVCSCTVQPAAHAKLATRGGQRPEEVCEHFERKDLI